MSKFLISANFNHNGKEYAKGKVMTASELEEVMSEKQAMKLYENGCIKPIDENGQEIPIGDEEPSEPEAEEPPPVEEPSAEEAPIGDEEPSEAPAEGKKKKGKK